MLSFCCRVGLFWVQCNSNGVMEVGLVEVDEQKRGHLLAHKTDWNGILVKDIPTSITERKDKIWLKRGILRLGINILSVKPKYIGLYCVLVHKFGHLQSHTMAVKAHLYSTTIDTHSDMHNGAVSAVGRGSIMGLHWHQVVKSLHGLLKVLKIKFVNFSLQQKERN